MHRPSWLRSQASRNKAKLAGQASDSLALRPASTQVVADIPTSIVSQINPPCWISYTTSRQYSRIMIAKPAIGATIGAIRRPLGSGLRSP